MRFTTAVIMALASTCAAIETNKAGSSKVGNGQGKQFITGGCVNGADCQSTCCAQIGTTGKGICSAVAAANQAGKTGCGFVDPNAAATLAAAQAQAKKQGF